MIIGDKGCEFEAQINRTLINLQVYSTVDQNLDDNCFVEVERATYKTVVFRKKTEVDGQP